MKETYRIIAGLDLSNSQQRNVSSNERLVELIGDLSPDVRTISTTDPVVFAEMEQEPVDKNLVCCLGPVSDWRAVGGVDVHFSACLLVVGLS